MKNIFLFFAATLVATGIYAQTQTLYMWPVEGAKAGEDIIYAPQSYIAGELNFAGLYITAPEGTRVVAPTGGTIRSHVISYNPTLSTSRSWTIDEGNSIDRQREAIIVSGRLDPAIDPRYLCGSVGLQTDDGHTIWIDGLAGERVFKTGQRIACGEELGRVAYSYQKIAEPSIALDISDKGGRSADPMTPFGLRTTFVAPGEVKPVVSLTREQAAEDFNIYVDALRECFVGLHNVISSEEFDARKNETLASLASRPGDIAYADFRAIIEQSTARIHDSHISLYPVQWRSAPGAANNNVPRVWFGFYSDTLRVSNAFGEHRGLVGRQISSINGIRADSIRRIVASRVGDFDAGVESYTQYVLGTWGYAAFCNEPWVNHRRDLNITFANGEEVFIKGGPSAGGPNPFRKFLRLNTGRPYETRMLADSVAYLGLGTFGLNQVQVEAIGVFIDSISTARVPNLVIDVRNNGGGHDYTVLFLTAVYIKQHLECTSHNSIF